MRQRLIHLVGIAAAVVCCLIAVNPAGAAIKVIGNFEGTDDPETTWNEAMPSPYTVDEELEQTDAGGCGQDAGTVYWCADTGIMDPAEAGAMSVPPEIIDLNDPADEPYWDAVTSGNQALLFTFPGDWGSVQNPYLRLHGQEQLLNDLKTTGFQYMAMDLTTFGGYDEPPTDPPPPEGEGQYRQVHTILNGDVFGFYGKNESGDDDIQRDFDMAAWDEVSFTTTVIQDFTGPLPPAMQGDANNDPDDGKIAGNLLAGFENPASEEFAFQLVYVFQGRDYPPPTETVWYVTVAIDNIRLCDTLEECQTVVDPVLVGDYNEDGKVSAADMTVWRDSIGAATLPNRDPNNTGAVDNDDFESWKDHYGEGDFGSGAGFAAGGVPEPSSLLLALCGMLLMGVTRRASR